MLGARRESAWSLALFVLLFVWVATVAFGQQAPPTDTQRRLDALERLDIDHRLTQIETRLDDITHIGYGVLIIVGGHLLLGLAGLRKAR